ncbi:uncharacterized protein PV06_02699 [Exophiala oligosperma]|uniref:polynucleotide adenylyltransferase n=1 Tax=Exophiala oligosperma TaxID=215243 RepID=A0A0D2CB63_9EURO|nr:uncharacterized protein PV06_02699 [Exophiala oligosperma]KIW47097.1 hypothetical protein PV06_02699 [Exophiala oligosperma]
MSESVPKDDGNIVSDSMTVPSSTADTTRMDNRLRTHKASASSHSQSQSMPSTPSQRPQSPPAPRMSRSPEPALKNSSPKSAPSDKSHTPPARGKPYGGCRFETGMARARRRVPYSYGPDPLEKDTSDLKVRLNHEEDEKLSRDMQGLYAQLQPSAESEQRRSRFIDKLEKILRGQWPQSRINVNVFGSTGNNLGTSDSDVDICITTDCREMERVCSIAELLAKHGMERVVCVSSAKVPIVKVWDPELQVACDINVNNPLALENTELVRTYVDLDERVRPLAMIIKHWAKRRILNDAALGGTLSSYTWICLTLNFLQTRDPPILPTLQQQPKLEPKYLAGVNVSFDRNTETYKDFGARNKSSLGELLFHFFRYYGHELDFEQNVVSVRLGRLLSKVEKQWHLLQDNRLCVEEPFNLSRNLANTADDTSMRGIHLELRRAFDMIGRGDLEGCCEQFEYPAEEIRPSEHFVPPAARPVIPQPPPAQSTTPAPPQLSRSGRTGQRGGRSSGGPSRNSNGRRSSNPPGRNYLRSLPFQMTPQELQLQAQHQQHLLHDQLFQQYQYLQLQEQELRMQLHQQNLRSRGLLPAGYHQPTAYAQYANQDEGADHGSNGQTNGISRAPLSAPLYQQRFAPPSPYLPAAGLNHGVSTNPPSPRISSVIPDTRRYSRRTSLTQSSSGGSLRAHSQPARAIPLSALNHYSTRADAAALRDSLAGRRSSASSNSQEQYAGYIDNVNGTIYDIGRRPAEYLGYYVGQSPSLSAYTHSTAISPIPSHAGLAIQGGGLSPRLASATVRPPSGKQSPSFQSAAPVTKESLISQQPEGTDAEKVEPAKARSGPLIVDGSINSPRRRRTTRSLNGSDDPTNFSASTSEDLAFDTPSSSDEQSQDALELTGDRSPPGSPKSSRQPVSSLQYANGHLPFRALGLVSAPQIPHSGPRAAESVGMTTSGLGKSAGTVWPLERQLSSVEEVRTPSPRGEGFPPKTPSPRATFMDKYRSDAPPHKKSPGMPGESRENTLKQPLSPRTNESVSTPSSNLPPPPSGGATPRWQTQKKKRKTKKTVKSENEGQDSKLTGGEALPADESLRKGG